jgi:hypothetical protein
MQTPRFEEFIMAEIVARREPATGCVRFAGLFQDRLLEEPPKATEPAVVQHRYLILTEQARRICAGCPLRAECLFDAVVRFDVSGYVAGTTEQQRREIRRRLGVTVEKENFDTLSFTAANKKPIDPAEVVRLRKACPDDTLESIADRLGCSLSTVKRHLRRHRAGRGAGQQSPAPAMTRRRLPSVDQVLATAADVLADLPASRRAA